MENMRKKGNKKKALITGITGQDGSYLAELLFKKGYEVYGLIRRSSVFNVVRIEHLYGYPDKKSHIFLRYGDLTDSGSINSVLAKIKPDEIYNLGAQSHVRISFDIPEYTAEVTGLGTLRMLEAMKTHCPKAKFYQASSSEMFGKVKEIPQNENTPFNAQSPYGIAKVFAHETACRYRDAYGLFISCGILFNHECLTAQTPVIIKISDFIDIVSIEEIIPHRENSRHGIKYSTINKNNLEIWDADKWTKVKILTATWNKANSSNDKKVKKIISRGGYYEATEDHISFLNSEKEIKTGEISAGDMLELKSFPDLNKKTIISLEEAEFLGMMVADGYVSSDGKGRFINNDKNLREKIKKLWQKIAAGCSREDKHPSGFNREKNVYSIEFSGNPDYLRFIHKEIYNQKLFKKVPRRILNTDELTIASFLKGYNSCDGLKGGCQKTEFKSFTTNSSVLALGLWYLVDRALGLRITLHPEFRKDYLYFHLNINSNNKTRKGKHLRREISEVKAVKEYNYTGWLFDLETESGTFSAGVGLTWVHNSPRRGENFVTRKIAQGVAKIKAGLQDKIYLGNLEAKRDWGYAPEFVEAMWLMLQQKKPDDFVIATGETHAVKEFVEEAFKIAGMKNWQKYVGIDKRYYRPNEVNFLQGDAAKAKKALGWRPKVKFKELAMIMVKAELDSLKK